MKILKISIHTFMQFIAELIGGEVMGAFFAIFLWTLAGTDTITDCGLNSLLSVPFGALFSIWLTLKFTNKKSNYFYLFLSAAGLSIFGVLTRNSFDFNILLLYAMISSGILTIVANVFTLKQAS